MPQCPLCTGHNVDVFLEDNIHTYLICSECSLRFAHPDGRLDSREEKSRYDLHQNDPSDQNYRNFLMQLFEPVRRSIKPGAIGLDYGSGPGPTLHLMFQEDGYRMDHYDPIYHDDRSLLERSYDFITVSETAEHFYYPGKEFHKLWNMLNPGGVLGIMTLMLTEPEEFENWYYRREDTHVAFYTPNTFRWISSKLNAIHEIYGNRIILLKKLDLE